MSRNNPTYNPSGCKDMTAYLAIRNVTREEKRNARTQGRDGRQHRTHAAKNPNPARIRQIGGKVT